MSKKLTLLSRILTNVKRRKFISLARLLYFKQLEYTIEKIEMSS